MTRNTFLNKSIISIKKKVEEEEKDSGKSKGEVDAVVEEKVKKIDEEEKKEKVEKEVKKEAEEKKAKAEEPAPKTEEEKAE